MFENALRVMVVICCVIGAVTLFANTIKLIRMNLATNKIKKYLVIIIMLGLFLGIASFSLPLLSLIEKRYDNITGDIYIPLVFLVPSYLLARGPKEKKLS